MDKFIGIFFNENKKDSSYALNILFVIKVRLKGKNGEIIVCTVSLIVTVVVESRWNCHNLKTREVLVSK